MDELKTDAGTHEPSQQTSAVGKTKPMRRVYAVIFAGVLLIFMIGGVLAHRKDGKTAEAKAADQLTPQSSDSIEPTPEQLAQVQVESVREEVIDVDLETT